MNIKILDKYIADKIAAGEVIERPLSIVKELVENSIDANADFITIEIRNGGKTYIRVSDNGDGIHSSDVTTAFHHHATGKIKTLDDLNCIETLGFRGEALSSIAAISRISIFTRTEEEILGTKVIIHAGKEVYHDSIGINKGTSIIVEDVFYNTPARRKFMRSDGAESSAIIDFIERIAIFYSNIKFRMINNGKDIFNTDGLSNVKNTIENIYPYKEYKSLLRIDSDNFSKEIKVSGYISDPMTTKKTRKSQIVFVNGRIVTSKTVDKGIEKGYGDRVFAGFPIAIIFIQISPKLIDVNIHPGKREIKFIDDSGIINCISYAINSSMKLEQSIPTISLKIEEKLKDKINEPEFKGLDYQLDLKSFLKDKREKEVSETREINNEDKAFSDFIDLKEDLNPLINKLEFSNLNIVGYLFNTYIITSIDDSVYIIDQHAAHERINYEKFIKSYNQKENIPQEILTPFTITVSGSVYNGDDKWKDIIRRLGFRFEDFGERTYIFRGIPKFMSLDEARLFASSFIDEMSIDINSYYNTSENELNTSIINKLIMKSCKMSVKGGDKLSIIEIQELIHEMSKCINPYSCPHGRPTMIKTSKSEIEKAFKRR